MTISLEFFLSNLRFSPWVYYLRNCGCLGFCFVFLTTKNICVCVCVYFRERERKGGRMKRRETCTWERNYTLLPLVHTLMGHPTCNPGMGPDQGSNQWHFTFPDDTQPSEPHWSGSRYSFRTVVTSYCQNLVEVPHFIF